MKRFLVLALLVLLAAGGLAGYFAFTPSGRTGPAEPVTITPGTTFRTVTDTLVARGIVEHRTWFTLLARIRNLDRGVQAGTYQFNSGESAWEVLNTLRSGRTAAIRFTVPEGLSEYELAALARDRLGIPPDSLLAAVRDSNFAATLEVPGAGLQGYLFPETYQVPVGSDARELVRIMVSQFQQSWDPTWTARLEHLGLRQRDLVTLASIVEGEARVDEERPVIAGVYYNRLRIGMPLQADPTVQYAIETRTGRPKPRLFEKDYQTPSRWNTYLHPGLPPGPINSPGLASLEATLFPEQVPFLYFVAGPDGRHLFSRTYQEHLNAVSQARRARGRVGG